MNKAFYLFLLLATFAVSCKKQSDFVKTYSFKNIVYEINNNVDSLHLTYCIGVYTSPDSAKGNMNHDTLLTTKGTCFISTKVLLGLPVVCTGISFNGGNFHLKIKDTSGAVMAETDTITHTPATPINRERFESQIQFTPQ
jgi:hypothetical protein